MRWFKPHPNQPDNPLDAEFRFHIERRVADYVRDGCSPAEARRRALLEFGSLDLAKEECRDLNVWSYFSRLWQDLCYAWRLLLKSPAFALVGVISLALGIGANIAIFSVVDALMLRALPVHSPDRLVALKWVGGRSPYFEVDSDEFAKYRDGVSAFSEMAASQLIDRYSVRVNGPDGGIDTTAVHVNLVSGNYFSVLGIGPQFGVAFTPADDVVGARPVAVISYDYWRRRFTFSREVLGKGLVLNGITYTILGVMPDGFSGDWIGRPTDFWVPLAKYKQVVPDAPGLPRVCIIGRLRTGVGPRQAEAAIEPVYQQVMQQWIQTGRYPPAIQRMWAKRVVVESIRNGYSPQREAFGQPLAILMGSVGLILLIACANIATLLLAKSAARQREIAVRQALGASKGRIVQQLMTESLLLSTIGGAFGVLFAMWGIGFLAHFVGSGPAAFLGSESAPANLSLTLDLHPDIRVIAFSVGLCALTGLLFGIAPAFRWAGAKSGSALGVRGSGTESLGGRFGLRRLLVVAQVALSLLLVSGAGLFVQTLRNLRGQDLGFDRRHVLLIWTNPFELALSGAPLWNLWHTAQDRLSRLPGVESAAVSNMGLINGFPALTGSDFYAVPGQQPRPGQMLVNQKITAGFFATVGIRVLRGRDFSRFDTDAAPPVVILNETMARFYFGEQDPIGQRLDFVRPHNFPPYTVVGVVRDTRNSLREARTGAIYYPSTQTFSPGAQSMVIAVRAAGNPAPVSESVRQELFRIKPDLPILKIDTVDEQIDSVLSRERLVSTLAGFFGVLGVLLACLGLYGVLSYLVARRKNEIGVRMALGADSKDILGLVFQESITMVICGIAIGVAGAAGAARLISNQFFGISPSDPLVFLGAGLLMALVGVAATLVPAWRAATVDPMVALRSE